MPPAWPALVVLAGALLACAPAQAPPRAASPPAAVAAPAAPDAVAAGTTAPAAPAAQPSAASAAEGGSMLQPNAAEWERLKSAARQDGTVVVAGQGVPGLREGLTEGFQRAYGVGVEYLGLPGGEIAARTDREAKAGNVTVDVYVGGPGSCWLMGERGQIEEPTKLMVDPALFDPAVWRGGQMRPIRPSPNMPRDFLCGVQTAEWVMTDLFVNPTLVVPEAITSWQDLLKPEYKGKIASFDPRRAGSSQTTVGYLATLFGEPFVRDLYLGQDVQLTADYRQLAEWIARGNYAIGIGLVQATVEPLRAQGLPLERVFPADGPGALTGGFGTMFRIKGGPHPNAAALFMNWFASKEAQEIWEREMMETSLRTDVAHRVPDYVIPKPGVSYPIDDYNPDYYFPNRVPVVDRIIQALGR